MRLFVFGLGYSARHFIARHTSAFTEIAGTTRSPRKAGDTAGPVVKALRFDAEEADPEVASRLAKADRLLVSIPPNADGDPMLRKFASNIAASDISRIIYLSSIGVYADHRGAWIDETAALQGEGRRSHRIDAEAKWRDLFGDRLTILRIAGIYGPGRNALVNLKNGTARRIIRPGQVFNRIHVDDIAQAIAAAFDHPQCGTWNLCDDEPSPPQDVVTYAASLMRVTPPQEQEFAMADLTPMARSFYASNNRVSNARIKKELKLELRFPTYREGLETLWRSENFRFASRNRDE